MRTTISMLMMLIALGATAQTPSKKTATTRPAEPAKAAAEKPKEESPWLYPPHTFTMADSNRKLWEKMADGDIEYPWDLSIDNTGRIIALIKPSAGDATPHILENGVWKPFSAGLIGKSFYFIRDNPGVPLLRNNEDKLFLPGDTSWTMFNWPADLSVGSFKVGMNGSLYGRLKHSSGDWKKGGGIVIWQNGAWSSPDFKGASLPVPEDQSRYAIDARGQIYTWNYLDYNEPTPYQRIHYWNGSEWKMIYETSQYLNDAVFDKQNKMYVCFRKDKKETFGYLENGQWHKLRLPEGMSDDARFWLLSDLNNGVWVEGRRDLLSYDERDKHIWQLQDTNYVFRARDGKNFENDFHMIPHGNDIYALHYKEHDLYRYNPVWDVRTWECTTIPVLKGSATGWDVWHVLDYYYLLKQGDKWGIQKKDGRVVIRPVFDEITIRTRSDKPESYNGQLATASYGTETALCLRSGSNEIYLDLGTLYYGERMAGCWEGGVTQCKVCHGEGKIKDQTKQIRVQGEWVEGETRTSTSSNYERTWNSSTNSYGGTRTVTTTTTRDPGYRKPDTYRYETIAGGRCEACHGNGSIKFRQEYQWDHQRQQYTVSWKQR